MAASPLSTTRDWLGAVNSTRPISIYGKKLVEPPARVNAAGLPLCQKPQHCEIGGQIEHGEPLKDKQPRTDDEQPIFNERDAGVLPGQPTSIQIFDIVDGFEGGLVAGPGAPQSIAKAWEDSVSHLLRSRDRWHIRGEQVGRTWGRTRRQFSTARNKFIVRDMKH